MDQKTIDKITDYVRCYQDYLQCPRMVIDMAIEKYEYLGVPPSDIRKVAEDAIATMSK